MAPGVHIADAGMTENRPIGIEGPNVRSSQPQLLCRTEFRAMLWYARSTFGGLKCETDDLTDQLPLFWLC